MMGNESIFFARTPVMFPRAPSRCPKLERECVIPGSSATALLQASSASASKPDFCAMQRMTFGGIPKKALSVYIGTALNEGTENTCPAAALHPMVCEKSRRAYYLSEPFYTKHLID